MNSVVFVLVVFTHGFVPVPSTEFSTMEKCKKAIVQYRNSLPEPAFGIHMKNATCVRIEK